MDQVESQFPKENLCLTVINESQENSQVETEKVIENLLKTLKEERLKNARYTVICDALKDLASEDSLPPELNNKLKSLLVTKETQQCLKLSTNHNVLGLSDNEEINLLYSEQQMIKEGVEFQLGQKRLQEQQLRDIVGDCETTSSVKIPRLEIQDKILLDFNEKLNNEMKKYYENLMKQSELLEEFGKLRYETVPELVDDKIEEVLVQNKMNDLKLTIMNKKVRVNIFTESGLALNAYRTLIKDIQKQQEECKSEIAELTELKCKYKEVACREYDEILKSYLQYKASLEQKKSLFKKLNIPC